MEKYLILLLFAWSCQNKTNPKEVIVERQKEIKKQMKHNQDSVLALPPLKYADSASMEKAIQLEVQRNRVNNALIKEYDSLEFELKKY